MKDKQRLWTHIDHKNEACFEIVRLDWRAAAEHFEKAKEKAPTEPDRELYENLRQAMLTRAGYH